MQDMIGKEPPHEREDPFVAVFRETKMFGRIVMTVVIIILLVVLAVVVGAITLGYKAVT